jgi:TPR repeat protein
MKLPGVGLRVNRYAEDMGSARRSRTSWWRRAASDRAVPVVPDTVDALLTEFERVGHAVDPLFGDPVGQPFPGPAARRWALGVLFEAGVDADADPTYAAGILRRAEARLSASQAEQLIRALL